MKKILVALNCILSFNYYLDAQQNETPVFISKDSSFADFIQQNFDPEDTLKLCQQTSFLVRFRIDERGNVTNLAFSKGVDSNIKNDFQRIILSSNGKWIPSSVNQKKSQSQYLLLGIFISVESGCNQQLIDDYFNTKDSLLLEPLRRIYGKDSLEKKKQAFKKERRHTLSDYLNEKSALAMRKLFEFDDNTNIVGWNCIILGYLNFTKVNEMKLVRIELFDAK